MDFGTAGGGAPEDRAKRALDALAARRDALEALRREGMLRPVADAQRAVASLDSDLRRLEAIETSVSAADQRLGVFFHLRYVNGRTVERTAEIMALGKSTVSRLKYGLIDLLMAREDILAAVEAWSAGMSGGLVARHRRRV